MCPCESNLDDCEIVKLVSLGEEQIIFRGTLLGVCLKLIFWINYYFLF